MQLTDENYYSQEANREYMSVSQFKDFAGTYGKLPCEFTALEKLEERWKEEETTALWIRILRVHWISSRQITHHFLRKTEG